MINRLSHANLAVTDLDRAHDFYVDVLGLVVHRRSAQALWLRAPDEFDCWTIKLTLDAEAGALAFGFRVDSESGLDELAALHAELGLPHIWRPAEAEPGHGRSLRVRAATGHVVDFVHAIDEVTVAGEAGVQLPTRRSHLRHGVGPSRLDHVNLRVPDVAGGLGYWRDALGFSISEMQVEAGGEPRRVWLRRAPFSHDVAIARDTAPRLHHVAYAMRDAQALINAADVLSDARAGALEYGPGRHGTTDAFFLYIKDPDGNRIELFQGDYVRDLDRPPVVWEAGDYAARGLLWWGQAPPESFLHAGPLLERGLVDGPALASAHANGSGA